MEAAAGWVVPNLCLKCRQKYFITLRKKSTALRSNYVVERDKAIEKAIRQGDTSFIQSINSKRLLYLFSDLDADVSLFFS